MAEQVVAEVIELPAGQWALSGKESRFNRCCMEYDALIVGLRVEGDLPGWTHVRLWVLEGSDWVSAPLSKWQAGLNPLIPVRTRQDVTVVVSGIATAVTLVLAAPGKRATP